ncbi:MAG: hypothetical protein IJH39_06365 [Clostridia bacterium]|nr:hypothetical protein [Clostridia bacterium]
MNKTTPKTLYKVNKPVAIKINPIVAIGFILFFFLIFFVIGLLSISNMDFILNVVV